MCCAIDSTLFTHTFALGATANERQERRAWLAAHLTVETTKSEFSTAAKAVGIIVDATINASQSAAKRNVFFVNSVVARSFSHASLSISCCKVGFSKKMCLNLRICHAVTESRFLAIAVFLNRYLYCTVEQRPPKLFHL